MYTTAIIISHTGAQNVKHTNDFTFGSYISQYQVINVTLYRTCPKHFAATHDLNTNDTLLVRFGIARTNDKSRCYEGQMLNSY